MAAKKTLRKPRLKEIKRVEPGFIEDYADVLGLILLVTFFVAAILFHPFSN